MAPRSPKPTIGSSDPIRQNARGFVPSALRFPLSILLSLLFAAATAAHARAQAAPATAPSALPAANADRRADRPVSKDSRADAADDVIPGKVTRYVRRLLKKYDGNGNGVLEQAEWSLMQGDPRLADANADAKITEEELIGRVVGYALDHRIRPRRPTLWNA